MMHVQGNFIEDINFHHLFNEKLAEYRLIGIPLEEVPDELYAVTELGRERYTEDN